jgi:MFS family permease
MAGSRCWPRSARDCASSGTTASWDHSRRERRFSFFGGFFAALYGIFLIRDLGFSPLLMGITIGAGGVGSIAGSMLAGRMNRGLGYGPSLVASRLILSAFSLLIPLAGGPRGGSR